jgi:predicted TPR repeat methyltransferase
VTEAASFWDAEFGKGRYVDSKPIGFTTEIVDAARAAGIDHGLYVGCGNGRNYRALVDGGLDLIGLDVSGVAIRQLTERMPERAGRLVTGDLSALPAGETYPLVVAIQVLHHGDREQSHQLLADTVARVAPGGMLAIGIETVGTDVDEQHELLERAEDGSYTIRYLESSGELVTHFRTVRGVHLELAAAGLVPETLLQPRSAWRTPPDRGQTLELEGIYRRPG